MLVSNSNTPYQTKLLKTRSNGADSKINDAYSEGKSAFQSLPFKPTFYLTQPGRGCTAVIIWLAICAVTIPLGTLTRYLDLTGLDITVFGLTLHLTVYLPTLMCIPLVIWYGYFWGAIPAYFASFTVALIGGMPLHWTFLFAFSNPIGLAIYALFYRVSPLQTDMRDIVSVIGFVLISLVASLASSAGSFIWTHTNQVGIHDAYAVWQGWWLGEWLHALLIILPLLYLFGPKISAWLRPVIDEEEPQQVTKAGLFVAVSAFMLVLMGYVVTARVFGVQQAKEAINLIQDNQSASLITNAIDGMSYPLFILLVVMLATAFLAYQAILYWNHALRRANQKLSEKNQELECLANVDGLTGVLNRRKVMEFYELECHRAQRTQKPLSVIMLDVDNFKQINDKHGHLHGDEVLVSIARQIKNNLRPYDLAGRYGGEEFVLILPDTECQEAALIGERIRLAIKNCIVDIGEIETSVTVSIGVSSLQEDDDVTSLALSRADDALYQAKREGRDRVVW